MGKFLFSVAIATSLFIAGCITTASVMQSWVGQHESKLVSKWGAPDSVVTLQDGSKVYTWIRIRGDASGVHQGRQSFTVDANGKITYWSYENMPRFQRK
jgi:hypothetical protein